MAYFKNVTTLEELRKQYRDLLKQYHPDSPWGTTEDAQAINAEYDQLFKVLKDKHESKATGGTRDGHRTAYDDNVDEKLREVLQSIINLSGIEIEIIGCWIWVDGYTYPVREALSKLGFIWSGEKKKWYYRTESYRKKSHKKLSMDDMRDYFGCTKVYREKRQQLKQA